MCDEVFKSTENGLNTISQGSDTKISEDFMMTGRDFTSESHISGAGYVRAKEFCLLIEYNLVT